MIQLLTLLLWIVPMTDISDISKINGIKKKAENAFKSENWAEAVAQYSYLLDTLHIEDDQATMNLAHAFYQNDQKELAQAQYAKLISSKNEQLKSTAFQQLGALSNDPKTLEKALAYFKESIKSDPTNEDSRYNFELVKKKLKQQQDQQQNQDKDKNNEDQENEDQENKDQQNQNQKDKEKQEQENQEQENQDQQDQKQKEQESKEQEQQEDEQEGEEKEEKTPQQQTEDKLKEMNISEEKAQMILEALKNNEIQYIQQNRRKATKKKDSDKPDW